MAERLFRARSVLRAFLIALLVVLPAWAGIAARRGEPTLAFLAPAVAALRGLGRWLVAWWSGYGATLALIAAGAALVVAAVGVVRTGTRPRPAPTWCFVGAALLVALAGATSGLWLAAIGAAVVVAVGAVLNPEGSRPLTPYRPAPEALLGILVLGAVMRFVLIAVHPVGFGTHGIVHLKLSVDLVDRLLGGGITLDHPFAPSAYLSEQQGPMAVVNALGFAVFGVGFTQARLTQAVLGVMTIWLAFLFGRRLFHARAGLVLAFLIAVSPWHVAVSRFNDAEHVLATFQALFALWAVLRADQERTASAFAVAGLACALSWYVYATNQALLLVLLGYLGWRFARRPRVLGRYWRGLALFAVVFVVASLPPVVATVRSGRYLPIRSSYQVSGRGPYVMARPERVPRDLGAAVGALYSEANDPWFAKSRGGGLDAMVAVLLPAGLIWCVMALAGDRFRDPAFMLLLWTGVGLLPAVLLRHVEFRRLLLVELAAEVLAAIMLTEAGRLAARSRGGRRAMFLAVPLIVVAWAAVATYTFWDRVTVFESRSSTYWVQLVDDIRGRLGKEGIVAVVAANRDQTAEHLDAIRLGAYGQVRALAQRGVPLERAVQVVPVQDAQTAIQGDLRKGVPVRVVLSRSLADDKPLAQKLERVVYSLDPKAHREGVVDQLGNVALIAWNVAPAQPEPGPLQP